MNPADGKDVIQSLVPSDGLTDEQITMENAGFTSQKEKLLRLAGHIDLENTVSLGCAGAILTYLQRRRTSEYLLLMAFPAVLGRSVESFTLKGTM